MHERVTSRVTFNLRLGAIFRSFNNFSEEEKALPRFISCVIYQEWGAESLLYSAKLRASFPFYFLRFYLDRWRASRMQNSGWKAANGPWNSQTSYIRFIGLSPFWLNVRTNLCKFHFVPSTCYEKKDSYAEYLVYADTVRSWSDDIIDKVGENRPSARENKCLRAGMFARRGGWSRYNRRLAGSKNHAVIFVSR